MRVKAHCVVGLACLLHLAAACSTNASMRDTNGGRDVGDLEQRGSDSQQTTDSTFRQDTCEPGCHWDCFYEGYQCEDGKVWHLFRAPVPCCQDSDFEGLTRPICASPGDPMLCSDGCSAPDPRYAACLGPNRATAFEAHQRLLCKEVAPRNVGDPCSEDEDCRPAMESIEGKLVCDDETRQCVEQPRAIAPDHYGDVCDELPVGYAGENVTPVAAPSGCTHCYWYKSYELSCVRQAKTITCTFDEDCPNGSVCLCVPGTEYSVCGDASDRTTVEGRTAWMECR